MTDSQPRRTQQRRARRWRFGRLWLLLLWACPLAARADTPIVYLDGHAESVTAVDWSAETGALVTGSLDATVRMWDVPRRRSFAVVSGHADAISSLTLSRDGQLVASGSLDGVVLLDDVPHRQPSDRWPIDERATTLAIAPDGATLAVGYESGAITLHDANSGEATARLTAGGGPIGRLTFEADGAALVVTTADGRIERWSTAGQQQGAIQLDAMPADVALSAADDSLAVARPGGFLNLHRWPPAAAVAPGTESIAPGTESITLGTESITLGAPARRIAVSAAGDWFAVVGEAGSVHFLDAGATAASRSVTCEADVLSAVVTPDGTAVVAGGSDGVLRQCARADGDFAPLSNTLQGPVHDVTWCSLPESEHPLLATAGDDGTVRLWRYPPPAIAVTTVAETGITQMATTADGRRFAVSDAAGKIRIVDAAGGDVAVIDIAQPVVDLAFSADGTRLVTGAADGRVRIHTLASGGTLALEGLGAGVQVVAVSADGARVAASDAAGALIVWDPSDGAIVRRATLPAPLIHLAFRPGSHQLLCVSTTELRLWQDGADAPESLATFPAAARAAVLGGDGAQLAVAGEDDAVRLFTAHDGLLVGVMDASGKPAQIALSASGRRLAAATDAELTVWDVPSRRVLERRTLPATVTQIDWAADDERLAAGCADGQLRLVSLTAVAILAGHDGPVRSLATGSDKTVVLSGGDDATVRLWNLADTTSQRIFDGSRGAVLDVAVSPDGRRLAAAVADRYVRAWDTESAEMICAVATPATVRAVRFAGDADTLLAAGDDRVVHRLAVTTGNETERDARHTAPVRDLAWIAEGAGAEGVGAGGKVVSVAVDGRLRRWTPSVSGSIRASDTALTAVCFTGGGQSVAVADGHGTVTLRSVGDLAAIRTLGEPTLAVHTLRLAGEGATTLVAGDDRGLRGWNVTDGTAVISMMPESGVAAFVVGADAERCVIAGWDTRLRYVSLDDGRTLVTCDAQQAAARGMALSPDGSKCYTITATGELCRWQVPSAAPRSQIAAHEGPVYALALSADGATLASGGVDKLIKTWNIADGAAKASLSGHEGAVYGVAFHASELRLASVGVDKAVRWWDLASGKPAWEVKEGLPAALYSLALGSDGGRIFAGDASGKLHWLATADGAVGGSADAHVAAVYVARLNPTGTRLATLGHDGELAVWNTESIEAVYREQLPVGKAFALCYNPDGSRLAVATVDPRVLIVTLPEAAR